MKKEKDKIKGKVVDEEVQEIMDSPDKQENDIEADFPNKQENDIEADSSDKSDEDNTVELDINGEIEKLKKEKDELSDKYLRLNADFDNFRKRMVKEKSEIARFATESLILDFLNVIDNFDRAIESAENAEDVKTVVDGIKLLYKQFNESLENRGLKKMDVCGKPFDANFHDAVLYEENEDFEPDHIIEAVQAGYMLGEKVVRHPKVKVAK